ncbi:hypothetical protein AAG570_011294 [Ranatra chinensis]|uniref:Uncharacterized protein n=1 Tax=Ranatra chinensis TaxID=642074 RepID=A0ABD0YK76_9HEMI
MGALLTQYCIFGLRDGRTKRYLEGTKGSDRKRRLGFEFGTHLPLSHWLDVSIPGWELGFYEGCRRLYAAYWWPPRAAGGPRDIANTMPSPPPDPCPPTTKGDYLNPNRT